jgi:hypothetical protein
MSHGTIEPKGQVVVRRNTGNLKHQGVRYRLGIRPVQKTPVIQHVETGKMWHISWPELLDLAIADGIDEPFSDAEAEGDQP